MGIYDDGIDVMGEKIRYIKYALALALLLSDLYLALPKGYQLRVWMDTSPVAPKDRVTLWIEVYNYSNSPLTGSVVRLESLSPFLRIEKNYLAVPNVPPSGKSTLHTFVYVEENATFGDHLVRVFFTYPGSTEVIYYRVRVG